MVCFFFFCNYAPPPPRAELYYGAPAIYETAPPFFYDAPAVPDGMGGYVPFNNSRVLPDGELRPFDPAVDEPYYVAPPATGY